MTLAMPANKEGEMEIGGGGGEQANILWLNHRDHIADSHLRHTHTHLSHTHAQPT